MFVGSSPPVGSTPTQCSWRVAAPGDAPDHDDDDNDDDDEEEEEEEEQDDDDDCGNEENLTV